MIENATYYDTAASRFEKSPKLASVYDLVSIVIGNGSSHTVNEFMETYVGGDGSRCLIEDVDYHDLLSIPGIGKAKAIRLCASIELGRRLASLKNKRDAPKLNDSEKVFRYFYESLRHENQEHFIACFMNTSFNLLGYKEISMGSICGATIDLAETLRWALRYKAVSIVLVHNHPSGQTDPSDEDKKLTKSFVNAAKAIDVHVADHVIIGDSGYYSFQSSGLLNT